MPIFWVFLYHDFFLLSSVSHLHMFHHSQNKQHPRHRFVLTIMNQCFNFSFISMSFTSSYASQQIFYSLCVTFFILLSFFKLSAAFDTCFVLQSVGRLFYLVIFLAVQCFHRLSPIRLLLYMPVCNLLLYYWQFHQAYPPVFLPLIFRHILPCLPVSLQLLRDCML